MAKVKVLPRSELCSLLNMKANKLRAYISKGNLKESQKGFINVYNPVNQEWIVNYCSKNEIDYLPIFDQSNTNSLPNRKTKEIEIPEGIEEKIEEVEESFLEDDIEKAISNSKLREQELKKKIKKLEIETKLKNLEFDKKKAKIVPVEFVTEMIQRYLLGTCGGISNKGHSMIEKMCDEMNADIEVKLKYKKMLDMIVNETIQEKHQPVSDEIIEYAKEYALSIKW